MIVVVLNVIVGLALAAGGIQEVVGGARRSTVAGG